MSRASREFAVTELQTLEALYEAQRAAADAK
jgi:hypothetical protein